MEPLCYDKLTFDERIYLGSLSKHPGFIILKKLFEDACNQAVQSVIKLSPEDPEYDRKLRARQLVARTTNDVCATLLKSIMMHSEAGELEESTKIAQEELKTETKEFGEAFGSFQRKSRKEEAEI